MALFRTRLRCGEMTRKKGVLMALYGRCLTLAFALNKCGYLHMAPCVRVIPAAGLKKIAAAFWSHIG